jgi:hypothetical protein
MPELADQLRAELADDRSVSDAELDRLWWSYFDESFATRRGREVFLRTVRYLDTGDAEGGDLDFRLGGWQVDLGKTAVQAGLVSAFLGGVLAVLGVDQVPVEVLPAVVPLVFDIRRSRLTKSQEYVLAQLTVDPAVRGGERTVDELYAAMPPEVRESVSRVDFEDFVEAFRRAGVATTDGGTVTVTTPENARFRITFQ